MKKRSAEIELLEPRRMLAVAVPFPTSFDGLMFDFYATQAGPPFVVGEHDHLEFDARSRFRDIDPATGAVAAGTYTLTNYADRKVVDLNYTVESATVSLYLEMDFVNGFGGTYYLKAYNVTGAFAKGNFAVNPQAGAGTIRGTIFDDRNGDGRWGHGEPPMVGAQAFIDKDGDGVWDPGLERARATDEYGRYAFKNINTGYHQVRATLPSGYRASRPTTNRYVATLLPGATVNDLSFAQTNTARITGQAFYDSYLHNRVIDSSDLALDGWAFLDLNRNGVLDDGIDRVTALDDTSGGFAFTGLTAGEYVVRVKPRTGKMLAPARGYYKLTLSAGQSSSLLLFLCSDLA